MSERLTARTDSDTNEVWVACAHCGKRTRHYPLASVATHDSSDGDEIRIWEKFKIVQCGGCNEVSFYLKTETTEDEFPTIKQYPNRIAGRNALEHIQHVPFKIRKVYDETRDAIGNEQPVLAGIGIRAIVETICKERNAAGGNLEKKIDDLVTKGIVTSDGAKILHNLRFMGNEAAHEVTAHSAEELITALDVVEYLLKGVYGLPHG